MNVYPMYMVPLAPQLLNCMLFYYYLLHFVSCRLVGLACVLIYLHMVSGSVLNLPIA
jgi:hypothetical protein